MSLSLADDDIICGGLDIVTDKKKKKNQRQSKKPPSLRLRGLITNYQIVSTVKITFVKPFTASRAYFFNSMASIRLHNHILHIRTCSVCPRV